MLCVEGGVVVLGGLQFYWAVKKCHSAKMTFDSRPERGLGVNHEDSRWSHTPGRGTGTCKAVAQVVHKSSSNLLNVCQIMIG